MALPPGNYRIVNFPGGDLAVQFNGENVDLTVVPPDEEAPLQMWIVVGLAGEPQSISPQGDPALQTQPAGGFVQPQVAPFAWTIVPAGGPGVFQIQEIALPASWGIPVALVGQPVNLAPPGANPNQNWSFVPVPGP